MTTERVNPLVFDDERLDDPTYINIIKDYSPSYTKESFKQNNRWYYVQDNALCHKSIFAME